MSEEIPGKFGVIRGQLWRLIGECGEQLRPQQILKWTCPMRERENAYAKCVGATRRVMLCEDEAAFFISTTLAEKLYHSKTYICFADHKQNNHHQA